MVMEAAELGELKRLYLDEGLALQAVGERFGISRQAVQDRLRRAGVPRRARQARTKPLRYELMKGSIDLEALRRLYLDQKLPVYALARRFGCSYSVMRQILVSEGITIRHQRDYLEPRYPAIFELEVNQSAVFNLPNAKASISSLHAVAKRLNRRITTKKIAEGTYRVTRIA
jgi:transposase